MRTIEYKRLPRDAWQRRRGYKYELTKRHVAAVNVVPQNGAGVVDGRVLLTGAGFLAITEGFCWDGPSGPTFDTPNFRRGSLYHDALYGLGSKGLLAPGWRRAADLELIRVCREDGMSWLRSRWVYLGVRAGGWVAV